MDTSELNICTRHAAQPEDFPKIVMTILIVMDTFLSFFLETICVEDANFTTFSKQFHIFFLTKHDKAHKIKVARN